MTDEELEKKALESYWNKRIPALTSIENYVKGYIAGAKENAPVWHDLRKNPDDLPAEQTPWLSKNVIATIGKGGFEAFYNYLDKRWEANISGLAFERVEGIIAWCEIPKFKEE